MKSPAEYLENSMNRLIKEGNLRDLGKMFGDANEDLQCDWIAENTSFTALPRSDFDDDPDASGYDLKTQNGMLIQSKVRVKDIHLVLVYYLPAARRIRIRGNALEHHGNGAVGQRAIKNIGVACDPSYVRCAPVDIAIAVVKGVLERHRGL